MPKRVLLVSPFFFPEQISTGKWNTYIAKGLAERAELTVLCLHPFYPEWRVATSNATVEHVDIVRRGRWLRFPNHPLVRRLVLELYFGWVTLAYLARRRERYDELVFVFPPSLMAYLASLLFAGRKVGIVHDLQGIYAKKSSLGSVIGKAIAFVESRAFRSCDRLIFLSNEMRSEASSAYALDITKSAVAYPFVTISDFDHTGELDALFGANAINLVYSGALGQKQHPQFLAELFARTIAQRPDVRAHIFSRGAEFERIKSQFATAERFHFHDLVDEAHLPELLSRSDVQIIVQAEGTSSGSLPSKLPNILASGNRLFLITDAGSELESLLDGASGVVTTSSRDLDQLAQELGELLDQPPATHERADLMAAFSIDATVDLIGPTT